MAGVSDADRSAFLQQIESDSSFSSVYIRYIRGRLMINQKNWPEALQVFTEIYNKLKKYKYQSIGFQVECQYWMALAYHKMGKDKEARDEIALALAANLLRDPSVEMESNFESYDEILEKIETIDEELTETKTASGSSRELRSNTVGTL
jgi:tetratricopeptide (TPR) repeat protein